jgi:hypothetical protein
MIEVIFAGDFAPCRRFEPIVKEMGAAVFGDARERIIGADLSFVNLECPLTIRTCSIAKAGPALKADPLCVKALTDFDLVGLANNHIRDYGAGGVMDTMNACRSAGLRTLGAGGSIEEASEPAVLECKGFRVAVIALAEHEFNLAGPGRAGAAGMDPVDNYRQIENARAVADLVLVTLHAGNEGFPYPRPGLRKLCRHYIELGVAAVVCHHPHIAGAYEVYKGSPIIYSLGNLVFDPRTGRSGDWHFGYLAKLTIEAHTRRVSDLELIPYRQSVEIGGVRLLHGDEKTEFLTRIEGLRRVVEHDDSFSGLWNAFVEEHLQEALLKQYLPSRFRGVGLISRFKLAHKLLGRRGDVLSKVNTLRCESHRELLIAALQSLAVLDEEGSEGA